MNTNKILVGIVVALFTAPALASAAYQFTPGDYPSRRETLVEGHTVFAVINANICLDPETDTSIKCPAASNDDVDVSWDIRANMTVQRLGAAVAVLVRDRVKYVTDSPIDPRCYSNRDVVASIFYENPGVLWFNDQFLVGDDLDIVEVEADANLDVCLKQQKVQTKFDQVDWRYPCGGWILATQAGNPDPRSSIAGLQLEYQESYYITDPNNQGWLVHKYGYGLALGTGVTPVDDAQAVPIAGDTPAPAPADDVPYGEDSDADDAADKDVRAVLGSYDTTGSPALQYYLGLVNVWAVPVLNQNEPDGGPGTSGCPTLQGSGSPPYNAVLFFFFDDLAKGLNGLREHGKNGASDGDWSYCAPTQVSPTPDSWGDCPAGVGQGNSHAPNDATTHPYNSSPHPDSGPRHLHPTAAVDLYFTNVQPPQPAQPKYAIYDTMGSDAPNHVHGDEEFDDRIRISPCFDADAYSVSSQEYLNGGGGEENTYETNNTEVARYGDGTTTPSAMGPNGSDCTSEGYLGGTTGSGQNPGGPGY